MIGLTMTGLVHYVSPLDPDKGTENETRFQLGSIDRATMARIMDKALVFTQSDTDANGSSQVRMNEVNYDLVRAGLRGWTNFKDAEGNDIAFATVREASYGRMRDMVSHECMDRLSMELITDLARKINELNSLTKAAVKN